MIKKMLAICNVCRKIYKFEQVHGEIKEPITCECGIPLIAKSSKGIQPTSHVKIIIDDPQYKHHVVENKRKRGIMTYEIHADDKKGFKVKGSYKQWYNTLVAYNRKHHTDFASIKSLLHFLFIKQDLEYTEIAAHIEIDVNKYTVKNVMKRLEMPDKRKKDKEDKAA